MVTHTGEIAHTAAANEDGAVLVEVVTFAGNVNGTFLFVRQAHPCDFTQSRVRLFGDVVETERQTPLFCGQALMIGVLLFSARCSCRA